MREGDQQLVAGFDKVGNGLRKRLLAKLLLNELLLVRALAMRRAPRPKQLKLAQKGYVSQQLVKPVTRRRSA